MTTYLVTGGGGFLGGAICRRLIERGDRVRSLQRSDVPALKALGVECVRGDIADFSAVQSAVQGCDAVFHVAAKAGVWGPPSEYENANVTGTENVIRACREAGIGKLVHTSSPSVIYHGVDESGIDESTPYPDAYLAEYPRTKAIGERLVKAANSPQLATVALRPHFIWGPGDNHLFPRIVDQARKGKLRRIADGRNLVDATYIDNAVDAHLAAMERVQPGAACAGKVYFISNGEPMPLWDLINGMLACADLAPITKSISPAAAYRIGTMLEFLYGTLRLKGEPRMTRFVARLLSTAHWYDLTAAKRDLDYHPRITTEEGLKRLRENWHSKPR